MASIQVLLHLSRHESDFVGRSRQLLNHLAFESLEKGNVSRIDIRDNKYLVHIEILTQSPSSHYNAVIFFFAPLEENPTIRADAKLFFRATVDIESSYSSENAQYSLMTEDVFSTKYGEFVCILPDRSQYYELFNCFGSDKAISILIEINDIAALNLQKSKMLRLDKVLSGGDLTRYLQNNIEAFLSYMSLGKIYERERRGYGPVPKVLLFGSKEGTPDGAEFEFDFSRGIKGANLINVVIGPNGVGKTRALTAFANSTVRKIKSAPSQERLWPSEVTIYSHDPVGFKEVVARNDISLRSLAAHRSQWMRLPDIFSRLITDDSSYYKSYEFLSRLFADVISLDRLYFPLNKAAEVPAHFVKYLLRKSGVSYAPLRMWMEETDPRVLLLFSRSAEPLVSNKDGNLARPSSGEMTLFLFLVSIMTECQNGTLILIDEPENHLHPHFISLLMQKLHSMLLDADSLAIIVTHSPFVVRELDKSCVTIMKHGFDDRLDLYTPTLQTHGANVSEISAYVFEDESIRKGYEIAIDAMLESNPMSKTKTLQIVGENFGADAVNYVLQKNYD